MSVLQWYIIDCCYFCRNVICYFTDFYRSLTWVRFSGKTAAFCPESGISSDPGSGTMVRIQILLWEEENRRWIGSVTKCVFRVGFDWNTVGIWKRDALNPDIFLFGFGIAWLSKNGLKVQSLDVFFQYSN